MFIPECKRHVPGKCKVVKNMHHGAILSDLLFIDHVRARGKLCKFLGLGFLASQMGMKMA